MSDALTLGPVFDGKVEASRIIIGAVAILPDGSIERTDRFTTTDAAALEFWDAVHKLFPALKRAEADLNEAFASRP